MKNDIVSYEDLIERLRFFEDSIALIDSKTEQRITYSQLADLSKQITLVYSKMGLQAGDRIVLFDVGGLQWVPLFLGAQLLNITVVPIDSRVSSTLLRTMIKKTGPTIIISDSSQIKPSKITHTSKDIISRAKRFKIPSKRQYPHSDFPGQILMTSGTWSRPKGVTLQQSNILSNMNASNKVHPLKADEVFLSILPLAHAYEQMCGLHMPLSAGCTIVYIDEVLADTIKTASKKYGVTYMVAVPRVLELFKRGILRAIPSEKQHKVIKIAYALRFMPVSLRRKFFAKVHQSLGQELKTMVVGGAPLELKTDKFFQGLGYKTLIGYGLSETAPIISISTGQYRRSRGDVGNVLENLRVKTNANNELLVKGPSVFHGYWPDKDRSGWFNTGDQVQIHNNKIKLIGRTKNLLIFPSGDKLAVDDLEQSIDEIAGVDESMIVYQGHKDSTTEISIIYSSNDLVSPEDINRLVSKLLPYSVHVRSVSNIYPKKLNRTHTLKLSRQKNIDTFASNL